MHFEIFFLLPLVAMMSGEACLTDAFNKFLEAMPQYRGAAPALRVN